MKIWNAIFLSDVYVGEELRQIFCVIDDGETDKTTRMAGLRVAALPSPALGVKGVILELYMSAKLYIFFEMTSVIFTIIFFYPKNCMKKGQKMPCLACAHSVLIKSD